MKHLECANIETKRLNDEETTMKSIKHIICCCAVLSLLVAGCATTEHAGSGNGGPETKDVSAQEKYGVANIEKDRNIIEVYK